MKKSYQALFEPFTFASGATIENRFVMAPMTTQSSFVNGMVTSDELAYFNRRAKGLGAVITSCAQVREDGRFAGSLSAASDNRIESLSKLAESIQSTGAKAILQIFHVGRMGDRASLKGIQPVSASAVPSLRKGAEEPRELPDAEVKELVEAFGEATRRAIQSGFDGVELHGANTYLIQQFFSPHSNRRTDHWGGTLEKRMNFPLEVIAAAKKAILTYAEKPFIFGYRISPEELEEPGITLQDTLAFLDQLKDTGLDYIHISTGSAFQSSMRDKSDQTPVLQLIHERIGGSIPLIGVGAVTTPEDAVAVLDMGIPIVALGRELIVEPDWVEKVASGNETSIRKTISYSDQNELVIPDAMWEYIQLAPAWLPFETTEN